MKPEALQKAIAEQIEAATGALGDEIAEQRRALVDAYFAEPYGDEVADRSQVVSTDVADTIEWILPEIMEIMAGGEKVVHFAPVGADDIEAAEQETDSVNHVLMRKNDGWLILYSWFKDALMQKNGYVKRIWDVKDINNVESYEGISQGELLKLWTGWQSDGLNVEVEETGPNDDGTFDITVRLTGEEGREIVMAVPPDEMLISPRWNSVNLDGCPFVAHRPSGKTVSDLVAAGYDRKQVLSLANRSEEEHSAERLARFDTEDHEEADDAEPIDDAGRSVDVVECYLYVDMNDDGISELVKVTVAGVGRQILKWADTGKEDIEEVPYQPFSSLTPNIIPHRHHGRSVSELVDDLQRIKTVLKRQMLDNMYMLNNPTREIAADGIGESTIADLLVDRPGKIVRTEMPGHYTEHAPPPFLAQAIPAIEYIDSVRENRTGVTRYNQGLDANSLNKTASGIQQVMSAAQKKVALIARIFAETGVKHLMRGIHSDLRRNASKPMLMDLRGDYVEVNPRSWRDRSDVEINVALGTGNKEQRLGRLMAIAEKQEMHLMNGSPLVTPQNLHHTMELVVSEAGFKNPDLFFTDPSKAPPQPQAAPEPDPMQQAIQLEQMKLQAGQQEAAAKMQLDAQKAALEDDRKRDAENIQAALKIAEINAKETTAVELESIKAQAASVSQVNQPNG